MKYQVIDVHFTFNRRYFGDGEPKSENILCISLAEAREVVKRILDRKAVSRIDVFHDDIKLCDWRIFRKPRWISYFSKEEIAAMFD